MKGYIPGQGDFVVLSFDPQAGHEQKGRRPGLVVSKKAFNERTGLAFVSPITSTKRGYPFHVEISAKAKVSGVVMVDQTRSLDYAAREMRYVGRASPALLEEVLAIFSPIIF